MSGEVSLGSQLLSIPLTGALSCVLGGLGSGVTASINRALYIEKLIQKFDSTFYSPSFTDGCALGGAYAVGSMVERTAEVIDANGTKFCDSYPKATRVALIILSCLVTFTCAKHMNTMGYTYHPLFLNLVIIGGYSNGIQQVLFPPSEL